MNPAYSCRRQRLKTIEGVGAIRLLNFLKRHSFAAAVIIWALFVTYIIFFAEPRTVYIESEQTPEIIVVTETIEVPVEVENTAYYKEISLTDEQYMMVGKMVYAEAGNQPAVGKRAVIEVIFNRVLSEQWPDTVEDVLTQKGQFTNARSVTEEQALAQYEHIDAVLNEEVPILRGDCVYFATRKNANGSHYIQIGEHYFSY